MPISKLLSNFAVIFVIFIPTYMDILIWIGLSPETFYQKMTLVIMFVILSPLQFLFFILGVAALFAVNDR